MKYKDCLIEQDIYLREINKDESELYRALRNREDNCHFFMNEQLITEEMQKKWYDSYLENDTEIMFSIYEKKTNFFLGAVSLYHIDSMEHRAEVGRIIVDKQIASGKGYAAQAIHGIVQYGCSSFGIKEYVAEVIKGNYASYRSFEKNGFLLVKERKEKNKDIWLMERKFD